MQKNKRLFGYLYLYVGVALAIVVIVQLVQLFNKKEGGLEIENLGQSSLTESGETHLNKEVRERIESDLLTQLVKVYGKSDKVVKATIRDDSIAVEYNHLGLKTYTFLIDVDEYEVTYRGRVSGVESGYGLDIEFACTEPRESKFPDKFCVGIEYDSTISATLMNDLPLKRKTKNGHIYNVSFQDGSESFEAFDHPYLLVTGNMCGGKDVENEVLEDLKAWIEGKGYNPELFDISMSGTCVYHE